MPLVEYTCLKCGRRFEKLQKSAEAQAAECPDCGSAETRKEISSFSAGGAAAAESCFSGG